MFDPGRFALALAHTVRLVRELPDAQEERQAAVRLLCALCELNPVKLLADGDRLTVNSTVVTPGAPGLQVLAERLAAHRVAAVAIQQGPASEDVLEFLVAIAGDPDTQAVPQGGSVRVAFHPPPRPARAASDRSSPQRTPPPPKHHIGGRPAAEVLARAGVDTELVRALEELARDAYGKDVLARASAVAARVSEEIEAGGGERGLEALAVLVDLESEAPEDPRRHYSIVLGRALTKAALVRAADLVLDGRHAEAARKVLARSGDPGAEILAERVRTVQDVAERRLYLDALKVADPKPTLLVPMLDHAEWYVVEAAAELLGAREVQDGVESLGRALHHKHPKVREAAADALVRIGNPGAIDELRAALSADRDEVRQAAARSIGGVAFAALAEPLAGLVQGEETSTETTRESLRALVRIGSPGALRTVLAVAEPGGRVLGRKPVARRVAAVEALALSDDVAVRHRLAQLAEKDREEEVRDAAVRSLAGRERKPAA